MKCFLCWLFSVVVFFAAGLFASQFESVQKCPVIGKLTHCCKKVPDGACCPNGACCPDGDCCPCPCGGKGVPCPCCAKCPGKGKGGCADGKCAPAKPGTGPAIPGAKRLDPAKD